MIILTNKYGIDEAIVNACKVDNHVTVGDISCTQLIDAPQIRMLRKQNDVEEDVTDRIWSLMGTAIHHILELGEIKSTEAKKILEAAEVLMKNDQEKAAKWMYKFIEENYPDHKDKDVMTEVTLSHTIDGMTFSGTLDRFRISIGALSDYKNLSVWSYMNPESFKKFTAQQNVYAFLLRENGYEVNSASITAIFRDFSAGKKFTKGYPQKPIETIPLKLYSQEFMYDYLRKRIKLHKDAELKGIIPECTSKEMWATSTTYAVHSPGRTKAIKLFPNKNLAEAFLLGDGAKYDKAYIQERPGEHKRCDSYCAVKHVCEQNKRRLELIEQNK